MQEYTIEYWNMHRASYDRDYLHSFFLADDLAHAVEQFHDEVKAELDDGVIYLFRVTNEATREIHGVFSAYKDRVTTLDGGVPCFAA